MQRVFTFAETSPAAPGTAASSQAVTGALGAAAGIAAYTNPSLCDFDGLAIYAALVGATGGTLDVYIQSSPNQGTTWVDLVHFPQLAAGAAAIKYRASLSKTTTGTAPVVVGINLVPALAANTIVQGSWGDQLRLVMVAGASTSLGAAVSVVISAERAP